MASSGFAFAVDWVESPQILFLTVYRNFLRRPAMGMVGFSNYLRVIACSDSEFMFDRSLNSHIFKSFGDLHMRYSLYQRSIKLISRTRVVYVINKLVSGSHIV